MPFLHIQKDVSNGFQIFVLLDLKKKKKMKILFKQGQNSTIKTKLKPNLTILEVQAIQCTRYIVPYLESSISIKCTISMLTF